MNEFTHQAPKELVLLSWTPGVCAVTAVPGHRENYVLLGSEGTVFPSCLEDPGVRVDPQATSKVLYVLSPLSLLELSMCIDKFGT